MQKRTWTMLGSAILCGFAITSIWFAAGFILPRAEFYVETHGTRVPAFFGFAIRIASACFHAVYPLAFVGTALFIIGLLRRGPIRLILGCQLAFPWFAGVLSCIGLYLLGSASVVRDLAGLDQLRETTFYKRTLEDFAILESAEGRFKKLDEAFRKSRDLKMVQVRNASELTDAEAGERVASLVSALPKVGDPAAKRQILATLSLFRERIRRLPFTAKEVPRYVEEAGAPSFKTPAEALDWVAKNAGQDGWEPLPLFVFRR